MLIETTLTCNARCRMCVHSQRDMHGEMSLDLYRKIIRELADWGVPRVTLIGYGEPFADRHWLDRVEIARAAGLHYKCVSNGSLLRPDVLTRMLELGGWDEVTFSINGLSRDVYERMMPPLKRDKVYANVNAFLDLKRRLGHELPGVRISCIQTRLNAHECSALARYWSSRPRRHRRLHCPVRHVDRRTQREGRGLRRKTQRHAEDGSWLAPVHLPLDDDAGSLRWPGRAVLRRLRRPAAWSSATAIRSTMPDIFHGEPAARLRRLHESGQRRKHPHLRTMPAQCAVGVDHGIARSPLSVVYQDESFGVQASACL